MKKFKYTRHRHHATALGRNVLVLQVGVLEEPPHDAQPSYKQKIIWRDATIADMTEEVHENN